MHRAWFQSTEHSGLSSFGVHAFCFPYAGGSATSLRPLEETGNPEISLHLATLPGRGRRFGEPATSDISVLVNGFCDAIERIAPQRFVGIPMIVTADSGDRDRAVPGPRI